MIPGRPVLGGSDWKTQESALIYEWVLREYSRGGFVRTFRLNEGIDTANIAAKYTDGVLQISLPIIAGKENEKKEIVIN